MPTTENSSAGKTFWMSRWAMMLPIVARRSPAITTPPGKVAATIVVPWGARSPACPWGTARRDGSRSGDSTDRKSAKLEVPGVMKDAGRRESFISGIPARTTAKQGSAWGGSLAALLDERLHEVLGVRLEHVVDLVEDGVDVVVQGLLALGDIGLGRDLGDVLGLARLARLLLLLGHAFTLAARPPARGASA